MTVTNTLAFCASKARSLPLEWNPVVGSTQVGYRLTYKYWTRVEVTESDKRPILYMKAKIGAYPSSGILSGVYSGRLQPHLYIFDKGDSDIK